METKPKEKVAKVLIVKRPKVGIEIIEQIGIKYWNKSNRDPRAIYRF